MSKISFQQIQLYQLAQKMSDWTNCSFSTVHRFVTKISEFIAEGVSTILENFT